MVVVSVRPMEERTLDAASDLSVEQSVRRIVARRIKELRQSGLRTRNAIYGVLVAEAAREEAVHRGIKEYAKRHFVGRWAYVDPPSKRAAANAATEGLHLARIASGRGRSLALLAICGKALPAGC